MSLRKNILANYASQIYVTLIGIIMVPLYIKYMGAEAYGLVGFFAMLQAWFNLLDMGLSSTISRETARFRGGATDALSFRRLVRSLEGIFLIVAIAGGISLYLASEYIANHWLNASKLDLAEVQNALELMAIIVALRWMCGLYRGAISGAERLVWLGSFNAAISTLRFVLVLPVLIFVGASPSVFFLFQFGVAVVEFVGLILYGYQQLPAVKPGARLPWQWAPLKPVLKFSLTIAFTSSVWVLVTQTDKLVLSKILPLAEYGYFTLAVLVASGIMIISGPISTALLPRMSKMEAEGDHEGLIKLYRQGTQFAAVIAGATGLTVACFSESLLWLWTGDKVLAQHASPVLTLYALGNSVLAVAAFPYYLQYAKGNLRLHLIGNAVFVILLIPAIIFAANKYGGAGAGWVWLAMNLLSFVAWLPMVHHKFAPGLNVKWYIEDVLSIFMPMMIIAFFIYRVQNLGVENSDSILVVAFFGILIFSAGIIGSNFFRSRISSLISKIIKENF
jgi:O-antigen/teichoic acid export membrane protein